jgi:DNA-directed RNA polymerase subunit RPC12/RpoP
MFRKDYENFPEANTIGSTSLTHYPQSPYRLRCWNCQTNFGICPTWDGIKCPYCGEILMQHGILVKKVNDNYKTKW